MSSSFCPVCGNALMVKESPYTQFYCKACPYKCRITGEVKFPLKLNRKVIDDVLGGAEAWENVDKTKIDCPRCGNDYAFFMQIQTRSADEPMTTFYKCTNIKDCGYRWKEG